MSEITFPADSPVVALIERAQGAAERGRLAEARVHFTSAIERDPGHAARHAFGRFLARVEAYEEAIGQLLMVSTALVRAGDVLCLADVYSELAAVYREVRNFTQAARYQQRALSARIGATVCHDPDYMLVADVANLANDAMVAGDYKLAESLLLVSLSEEKRAGSIEGEAADLGSLGVLACLRNDPLRAIGFLVRAYALHRQIGDSRGAGCDLMNLAEAFGRVGRRQAAIRCMKRAIFHFERAYARRSVQAAQRRLEPVLQAEQFVRKDPRRN